MSGAAGGQGRTAAVIGGTGFIGGHVVAALRAAGWEVRALSRRSGCDARRIEADALRGCTAVINLAGIKAESGEQTFAAVHVALVERLVEAMRGAGVARLVHVSVVVARESELGYHDSKHRGEAVVRGSGLDWTILRPGVVYGVGDDLLSNLAFAIETAPILPLPGGGRAPMMPVHAADVAAAVVAALAHEDACGKTYDVVGPERLTLAELAKRVARALGRPCWPMPMPEVVMKTAVAVIETVVPRPIVTRSQLAMLSEGLVGDPEPARRELGLEPAPFSVERLRELLAAAGHWRPREIPGRHALAIGALAMLAIGLALTGPLGPWIGMTLAMTGLGALALAFSAVRRRCAPTLGRAALGLAAAAVLYGLTRGAMVAFDAWWPSWHGHAHDLMAWARGPSLAFVAVSLPVVVLGEELLWRGVITTALAERLGRAPAVVLGAALYAGAHAVAGNPLLVLAALGCGALWAVLALATDDLTAPFVCHLAWDATVLFLLPIA